MQLRNFILKRGWNLFTGSQSHELKSAVPYLIMFGNFVTMLSNYFAIFAFFSTYLVHWFTEWLMVF